MSEELETAWVVGWVLIDGTVEYVSGFKDGGVPIKTMSLEKAWRFDTEAEARHVEALWYEGNPRAPRVYEVEERRVSVVRWKRKKT